MCPAPRSNNSLPGTVTCLMLLLHIVLAVIIILSPGVSRLGPLLSFYRRFVVLGPFFDERRIASSPHVLISQYQQGSWSEATDFACLDVVRSVNGKYEALQRRSFELFLAEWASGTDRGRDIRALPELKTYLRSRDAFIHAESLMVVLVRRRYAQDSAYSHTVYQYKFKR